MHISSNGDGNFVMSKGAIAFSIFIITLFSIMCSVIVYGVTARNDIDAVISDVDELNNDVSNLYDKETSLRLDSETQWSVISSKLERIEEDIKEIKTDIKKMLEE